MHVTSPTPSIPSSTARILGPTQLKYCVTSYAPSEPVTVTEAGRTTATIHTNNVGAGCTVIAFDTVCGDGHLAVATGVGADGNPATSSASPAAAVGTTCSPAPTKHHAVAGGGVSSFAVGLLIGVIGAVLLAGAGFLLIRRRRSAG